MSNKKIKILFVVQKRCKAGSTLFLLNIAKRLRDKYNIAIASSYATSWKDIVLHSPFKTIKCEEVSNIPIYHLGFSLIQRIKILLIFPILIILRLLNKNKYRIQLINLINNGYKNKIKSIPIEYDIIYGIKAQLPHLLLAFQKYSKKPFLLTPLIHAMDSWSTSIEVQKLFKNSTKLLVCTEYENKWLLKQGYSDDKIKSIGTGLFINAEVKPNQEEFKNKYNLNENIILFIGRMRFQKNDKGWPELLKATSLVWKKHPNTHFVFIGSQDKKVKEYFNKYNDKRILNLGKVSEQEKIDALASCNIFAMPSASESFGETILEAWNFKKPVIGAEIEVSREIIENGKCGLVVRKTPTALARGITTLLDNPVLQKKLGENGYIKLIKKYNWDKIIPQIDSIIQELKSR